MGNVTKDLAIERGLDLSALPRHIGIIMDGNGRWAQQRAMPRIVGHRYGAQRARDIFQWAAELGVPALTLYAFSKENWSRPRLEIKGLIALFAEYIEKSAKEILDNGLRFRVIGDLRGFPARLIERVELLTQQSASNTGTCLSLALGYSGRAELIGVAKSLATDVQAGVISVDAIDEDLMASRLSTNDVPPLDFVIRTSGEQRISNFMLWQIAYAELFFSPKYWPDFSREDFIASLVDYQMRDRRFGRVSSVVTPVEIGLGNEVKC